MSNTMTLEALAAETLVQKNRRLRQEKCPHDFAHSSTVVSVAGAFTNRFCYDCGKIWHEETR